MENKEKIKLLTREIKKLEEAVFMVETQMLKRNQTNKEILADYKERLIKLEAQENQEQEQQPQ